VRRRDELAVLAHEMNAMCDRLAEAEARVAAKTASRLATMEQLRHADRLMTVGKLASGIAHELGTPINVISGRAQLIADEEEAGSAGHQNATIVIEQADRMATIIRHLLDFARRRQGARGPLDPRAQPQAGTRLRGRQLRRGAGGTSTIASTSSPSRCRRCARGATTSCSSASPSSSASPAPRTSGSWGSLPARPNVCSPTPGQATCGSCRTAWSVRSHGRAAAGHVN
jgi:hypothetical protein